MRVVLIGARRVRQGLGPFLARFVVEAGHELVGVVGSRPETSERAAAGLAAELGIQPVPAADETGVAALAPDALVIAAPHAAHARWLTAGLELGCHVLCEKPLVWGTGDDIGFAGRIGEAFARAARVLRVNAQWPWTLESFRRLHPDAPAVPTRFAMRMPPRTRGLDALLDSLSHPLSMLARLAPGRDADLEDLRVLEGSATGARWRLTFRYVTPAHAIDAEIELDATPDPARSTTYRLDDQAATRVVDPATYAMHLVDGDRRISLPDPTPRLVRSFLDDAARGGPTDVDPGTDPGVRHLVGIMAAATQHLGASRA